MLLPGEILWAVANLQVYLKVMRNKLLQVYDVSWKFRFCKYIRFECDRCSNKKNVELGFENTYDGAFLVNQRIYFCLKVLWKRLHAHFSMETWVLKKGSLNSNRKQLLKITTKRNYHNICSWDLAEFVFNWRSPILVKMQECSMQLYVKLDSFTNIFELILYVCMQF